MFILDQFWAPRKAYEPVGMFTSGHMILLMLCLIMLVIIVFISRKIEASRIKAITRGMAILMTLLEGIKIYFSFYWGYTWLNAWFPIAYCSIFMYALWLSGYGKGKWREMGDAFLGGVCIVAGGAFLLFPSTSLMMYPMWHYLSLYSMFFHTLMIYTGIMYLWKLDIKLDKAKYKEYVKLYLFFAIIAIVLNTLFDSNLMLLREPFKIPIPFLHQLFKDSSWLYTTVVFLVYLFAPYWVTSYINEKIKQIKNKKSVKDTDDYKLSA